MIEEQDQEKEGDIEEVQPQYSIDLEWYREQGRSFVTLASSRLCSLSHGKETLKSEKTLLRTLKQCCSKQERFITPNMPLLEMMFRAFLADGNQPLYLEELQEKLEQWLIDSSNPRDLAIPKLKRIIVNDRYYGLGPVPPTAA